MARYAIDAPTLVRLVTDDWSVSAVNQLVAPDVIRSHVLSLLFEQVQLGQVTGEVARVHLERSLEVEIELISARLSRRSAQEISREHAWTSKNYAAHYLAVATLGADALVTVDACLAARAEHIVALAPIEALTATDDDPT